VGKKNKYYTIGKTIIAVIVLNTMLLLFFVAVNPEFRGSLKALPEEWQASRQQVRVERPEPKPLEQSWPVPPPADPPTS
jgi:hypothetical protein